MKQSKKPQIFLSLFIALLGANSAMGDTDGSVIAWGGLKFLESSALEGFDNIEASATYLSPTRASLKLMRDLG